jgi:hypothetical protein
MLVGWSVSAASLLKRVMFGNGRANIGATAEGSYREVCDSIFQGFSPGEARLRRR